MLRVSLGSVAVAALLSAVALPLHSHFASGTPSSLVGALAPVGLDANPATAPVEVADRLLRAATPVPTRRPVAKTTVKKSSRPVVHTSQRAPAAKKSSTAHHATSSRSTSGPTSWAALNRAIARIPTYRPGVAHWIIQDTGWWATTDWYTYKIYISPQTPTSKLYDVVVHEWSHVLQVVDYGGNVDAAVAALDVGFGASGLNGAERAADCMAKLQGAVYLHYTQCTNSAWQAKARILLAGHRLPV
jgi:predicted component of type VI protein secretion system